MHPGQRDTYIYTYSIYSIGKDNHCFFLNYLTLGIELIIHPCSSKLLLCFVLEVSKQCALFLGTLLLYLKLYFKGVTSQI